MKYIDIFKQVFGNEYFYFPKSNVLAWTANHEHAVFDMQDEAHPATVYVWFQWWIYAYDDPPTVIGRFPKCRDTIYKCELKNDKWCVAEPRSFGRIPFVNNNPFDPRKQNAASNTAESVFPQNQRGFPASPFQR